ncbi:hypothetical protein RhiirC2_800541, partial [Rhizophagus irregularis]
MHIPTTSNQKRRIGPLVYYNSAGPDEYLSDSSSCTDNRSDLGSDDYNDYESNCESDSEEAFRTSTSTTKTPLVQPHAIYSLRKEKFNDDFTPKDLLDAIRKIALSPPRDMSNDKGSLDSLYRILDCGWKDILRGLVIATSSDHSKCSYHILYAPALLIDHHELKAFTELVYTITGEKYGQFIDQKLPGHNFNLRLIGLAKKGLEVRPRMLSVEKNNSPLKIIVGHDILQKCADLVLQKYSNYLRDCTIEEKDSENFVYFNRKVPLECPLCKRIHDKDQRWFGRVSASGTFIVKCFRQNSDEPGVVFECDPSIAEKIQQKNKNISSAPSKIKGPGFPKAFVKMPPWVKCNETLTATEIYEERYVRPLPNE